MPHGTKRKGEDGFKAGAYLKLGANSSIYGNYTVL